MVGACRHVCLKVECCHHVHFIVASDCLLASNNLAWADTMIWLQESMRLFQVHKNNFMLPFTNQCYSDVNTDVTTCISRRRGKRLHCQQVITGLLTIHFCVIVLLAAVLGDVVGRPHLSPHLLPSTSVTKAPNCMDYYSLTNPGGMAGCVGCTAVGLAQTRESSLSQTSVVSHMLHCQLWNWSSLQMCQTT